MTVSLVTGAAGFIGERLCHRLQENNQPVRALLRTASNGPWDESCILDLAEDHISEEVCQGVDTIYHLAGKTHAISASVDDDRDYAAINVEGTRKLLQCARAAGVRRFVFLSSVKVMGEHGNGDDETSSEQPVSVYGRTKLAAEQLVLYSGDVPEPVVLRLPMVYGPTRKGNLSRMIAAVSRRRFPPLPDTRNKRSMVHVDDVAQAVVLAGKQPDAAGNIYLVTDGNTYSTRQIYVWINEALEIPVPCWNVPLLAMSAMARVGDVIGLLRRRRFAFDSAALDKLLGSSWYCSDKIEKELGFNVQKTLHETIPEIISLINQSS